MIGLDETGPLKEIRGVNDKQREDSVVGDALYCSEMANGGTFAIRNFAVLAYAQGFTLWHYRTDAGQLQRVSEPRFFDAAADLVEGGDIIIVSAPSGARLLVITRTEGGIATAGFC